MGGETKYENSIKIMQIKIFTDLEKTGREAKNRERRGNIRKTQMKVDEKTDRYSTQAEHESVQEEIFMKI